MAALPLLDSSSSPPKTSDFTMTSPVASLSERINTATKLQHVELNRLLIQRLPLSLPPYVDTPLLFAKGLVPFAKLLILFEAEWELLNRAFDNGYVSVSDQTHDLRQMLASLRPNGLPRTHRLRHDLHHLRLTAGHQIFDTVELGQTWTENIRRMVRERPHTLVAFAWVYYMAVFSGGRWIRQQLAGAGSRFWTQQDSKLLLNESPKLAILESPGFTFLFFDGARDGEDLKALFKSRLADMENILTDEQKQDIVDVARRLFDRSIDLAGEIDRRVRRESIRKAIRGRSPSVLAGIALFLIVALGIGKVNGILSHLR